MILLLVSAAAAGLILRSPEAEAAAVATKLAADGGCLSQVADSNPHHSCQVAESDDVRCPEMCKGIGIRKPCETALVESVNCKKDEQKICCCPKECPEDKTRVRRYASDQEEEDDGEDDEGDDEDDDSAVTDETDETEETEEEIEEEEEEESTEEDTTEEEDDDGDDEAEEKKEGGILFVAVVRAIRFLTSFRSNIVLRLF